MLISRSFTATWRSTTLAAVMLGLLVTAAVAHQVHVDVQVREDIIHGKAYYHDDTPVRNAKVTALDRGGEQLERTTTDELGQFQLRARYRCDHHLLIDTGEGHGAEYFVLASELPGTLPPPAGAAGESAAPAVSGGGSDTGAQLAAIRAEIARLKQQLHEYERTRRLRDVLGAIGYILGLGGVAFYFLGVRRRQKNSGRHPHP